MSTEPNTIDDSADTKVSRRELRRFGVQVMVLLFVLSILSAPGVDNGWRWVFQAVLIVWAFRGFK